MTKTFHYRYKVIINFILLSLSSIHAKPLRIHRRWSDNKSHLPPCIRSSKTTKKENFFQIRKEDTIYKSTCAPRGGGAATDNTEASSTMMESIFNLVNNVAGAGILTLAAGKAKGTGWIPSIVICAVLGFLSSHTFSIIGEDCEMMNENNFKV